MLRLYTVVLLLGAAVCGPVHGERTVTPAAHVRLGDAGHFLTGPTRMHLQNPDGEDFALTVLRYDWPFEGHWNQRNLPVTVTGPDGQTVVSVTVTPDEDGGRIEVPGAGPGVYTVQVRSHSLNYWYVSATLPRGVVWTSPGTGNASPYQGQWLTVAPMIPRTWYFFVPKGTPYFTIRTQGHGARTQREDHGLIIRSPRGQPMAALWDQPDPSVHAGEIVAGRGLGLVAEAHVVVEPGSDGRFWSLEIRLGGGHLWTDFPVALLGVPPYLSPTPEQWFNPDTGLPAPVSVYDDTPFVRTDLPPEAERERPYLTYWMPAPALGDPASNELRAPARIHFQNPEGRTLQLSVATYLPRGMQAVTASVRFSDADGQLLLDETAQLPADDAQAYRRMLTFTGTGTLDVEEVERFWAYTYPAVPAVLAGARQADGWARFHLESGGLRHWFFRVPEGVRRFAVRMETQRAPDIVALDIHAPDRLMGRLYGRQGTVEIEVPAGLDGLVWHLRIEPGGASRYLPDTARARYALIPFDLDLEGVPAFLAPTYEQWFLPDAD